MWQSSLIVSQHFADAFYCMITYYRTCRYYSQGLQEGGINATLADTSVFQA